MHAPIPAEVGELFGLDVLSRELSEGVLRAEVLSGANMELRGLRLVSGRLLPQHHHVRIFVSCAV